MFVDKIYLEHLLYTTVVQVTRQKETLRLVLLSTLYYALEYYAFILPNDIHFQLNDRFHKSRWLR